MSPLMFIPSHFISDFSFCVKDVFFGLFDDSKENIGKYNLNSQKSALNLSFLFLRADLDE